MLLLPDAFLRRMKDLLGSDYQNFLNGMQKSPNKGLRVNTLKVSADALREALPWELFPSPFCKTGFLLPEEAGGLGLHPLHHAGAYYLQEPSAMSAVTALAPQPGERILDLCAAPGGKSTQIAAALQGKGLIWSNEIVPSRARVLLSNMERMGVRNAVVSSCHPQRLCTSLAGFFDRVLVDAPCSGEGMFRKDPGAAEEWSPEHVSSCALRQKEILFSAACALRKGGVLVYSTCTFSPEENEGVISAFLEEHPEFSLEEIPERFGRAAFPECGGGKKELLFARRIFSMDGGEGHFVARLRKNAGEVCSCGNFDYEGAALLAERTARELFGELFFIEPFGRIGRAGGQLLILPEGLPALSGLGVLRAGVQLAEEKKNRLEPAHALFLAAKKEELRRVLDFGSESTEIAAFLRGEEISAPQELSGFSGVSVCGVTVGFGKCVGGRLKNRYPKGLRNLR